jgi:hypothetical protein
MAFPGMAPGMGAGQNLDEQQMKEQQMIKYVRRFLPVVATTLSMGLTDPVTDANGDGIVSCQNRHLRCHGFWIG